MGFLDFFTKKDKPGKPDKPKEGFSKELAKTCQIFWGRFSKIITGKTTVDSEVLDKLEELLISSDVGVATTLKIIESIEQRVKQDKYTSVSELDQILRAEVEKLLFVAPKEAFPSSPIEEEAKGPTVLLVVGVNVWVKLLLLVNLLQNL